MSRIFFLGAHKSHAMYDTEVYKDIILDLSRNPLHAGVLESYDATAHDVSTSCGDDITVYLKHDASGRIADISHDSHGCAIAVAAVSLVADAVKGKAISEALAMTADEAVALLGIPISYARRGCATLGLAVAQQALSQIK